MVTRLQAIMVMGLVAVANTALACPVCFSAKNKENQIAYLVTTGFLTFLPLMFAGGVIFWVRRRAQQASEDANPGEGQLVALGSERGSEAQG